MKKQILYLVFAMMANFSFAQSSLDLRVEVKIKELQKNNVSDIINYYVVCMGSELRSILCDTCC